MRVAHDLLTSYQHVVKSLTLLTGDKGVFDVTVDGEVLFSKHDAGRHADEGELLDLFVQRYARDVRPSGD